jgi:hypothetical protein
LESDSHTFEGIRNLILQFETFSSAKEKEAELRGDRLSSTLVLYLCDDLVRRRSLPKQTTTWFRTTSFVRHQGLDDSLALQVVELTTAEA